LLLVSIIGASTGPLKRGSNNNGEREGRTTNSMGWKINKKTIDMGVLKEKIGDEFVRSVGDDTTI
jgi:hypothetical protein